MERCIRVQFRAALRGGSQDDINIHMGARYGMLPRDVFYTPENLARIFAAAER